MGKDEKTRLDRSLARICELCPVCRQARRFQRGIAFSIVKNIETSFCPFCMAYERVHGIKAHERRDKLEVRKTAR
ncbi:MAG: hypothetical protein VB050_07550 [Geobacteraceae bacterium]|nr:hypothetical protein [Geobacteraceae bacterium]